MYIRNMYLDHRRSHRTNGILQSDGGMGISAGIQNDAVYLKTYLLNAVNHFSLNVRLKIVDLQISISFTKLSQIVFKCNTSVYGRFTFAQQIDVRAINNLYSHRRSPAFLIPLYPKNNISGYKGRKKKWKSTKKTRRRSNKH